MIQSTTRIFLILLIDFQLFFSNRTGSVIGVLVGLNNYISLIYFTFTVLLNEIIVVDMYSGHAKEENLILERIIIKIVGR